MIFQRLAEEALGGLEIALGREEEINRVSVLVDNFIKLPWPYYGEFEDS